MKRRACSHSLWLGYRRQSRQLSVPRTRYSKVHRRAGGRLAKPMRMPAPTRTTTIATTMLQRPRTSGRRVPAVEEHGLPGHEVGPRRREQDDERADLLQASRAPHRDVARETLVDARLGERLLVHVGDEPPRGDGIHLHVVTRPLDAERARHNVQVNAIAPGWFVTDMNEQAFAEPRINERLTRDIPMRRTGRLEEIGPLVVLLASSGSDFMTGQTVFLDGGHSAA